MSMYGDERMHMEEWQHQLMERARQVGPQQAMREMLKVVHDFTDTYWTEQDKPVVASERGEHCLHSNIGLDKGTKDIVCLDCRIVVFSGRQLI